MTWVLSDATERRVKRMMEAAATLKVRLKRPVVFGGGQAYPTQVRLSLDEMEELGGFARRLASDGVLVARSIEKAIKEGGPS